MDSVAANAAFAEKYGLTFPLLCDLTGEVCRAYGACADPPVAVRRNTYVIGADGVIMRVDEDVTPEDQGELVVRFLQERVEQRVDDQAHDADDRPAAHGAAPGEPDAVQAPSGEDIRQVLPSETPVASNPTDGPQLVFALGMANYAFLSQPQQDSFAQQMGGDPNDPRELLAYLQDNPSQAAAITWVLTLDGVPIYAIEPAGAFASAIYERLRQFLSEQLTEGVERISLPGVLTGKVSLMSGQVVPVVRPELSCMYSWTTTALVRAVAGEAPAKSASDEERTTYAEKTRAVTNFLERVYHELRNLGRASPERALNCAATNAAVAAGVFESALREEMELDSIEVKRSPISKPGSDSWDVLLYFFNPSQIFQQARRVYRFDMDVSVPCPVVGVVRSWSTR
jgi:cyanobactin maturation PatA/PatG family protease